MTDPVPSLVPVPCSSLSLDQVIRNTDTKEEPQLFHTTPFARCCALQVQPEGGYTLVEFTGDDRRGGAEGTCTLANGECWRWYQLYPREYYLDAQLAAQALDTYTSNYRHRLETEIGWRIFGIKYIRSVGTIAPGVHVIRLSTGERGLLFDLHRVLSQERAPWGGTYHEGLQYYPFPAYQVHLEESHPHWTERIARIVSMDARCTPNGPRLDLRLANVQRVLLTEQSHIRCNSPSWPRLIVSCFGLPTRSAYDWQLLGSWQSEEGAQLEAALSQIVNWHPGLHHLDAWKQAEHSVTRSGSGYQSTSYEVFASLPHRALYFYGQTLDVLLQRMLPALLLDRVHSHPVRPS